MPNSIKFDNTEIRTTSFTPRFIKHESATDREIGKLDLARENGSVMVSDRRGTKIISLQGFLSAASQSALETAIDSMKELFSRVEKYLDIEWEGSTRRYVATCQAHSFDRDHFHNNFVPWTAEFIVMSGIGEAISEDAIVTNDTFTANYKTKAITLLGSAEPKIRFSITIDSPNNTIKGLELKNTDNGDRIMVIHTSSLEGKVVEVDTRLKTVKIDGVAVKYYGVFPRFNVGVNNILITTGDVVDQQFAPTTINSNFGIHSAYRAAQGFSVPYYDSTYTSIWLELAYIGSPAVALDVRIETDLNGAPSGTLADANAYGLISPAEMAGGATRTFYQIFFNAAFVLQPNTKYWIVIKPHASGLNSSNYYQWFYEAGVNATYKLGNAAFYDGAWAQYADNDLKFKLCYGGKMDAGFTQTYSIYQTKRYL